MACFTPPAAREPLARCGHAAVASDLQMLIWGGDGGNMAVDTSSIEIFDLASATWLQPRHLRGQNLPEGLYCMALACDGKRAYMFGGATKSKLSINEVYEIDLKSLECRMLEGFIPPFVTRASAMVYYERMLVNYGGHTDSVSSAQLNAFNFDESKCSDI